MKRPTKTLVITVDVVTSHPEIFTTEAIKDALFGLLDKYNEQYPIDDVSVSIPLISVGY